MKRIDALAVIIFDIDKLVTSICYQYVINNNGNSAETW